MIHIDYDNQGRRQKLTRGNGVTTVYGYDPAWRLNDLTLTTASATNEHKFAYTPADEIAPQPDNGNRRLLATAQPIEAPPVAC